MVPLPAATGRGVSPLCSTTKQRILQFLQLQELQQLPDQPPASPTSRGQDQAVRGQSGLAAVLHCQTSRIAAVITASEWSSRREAKWR